MLSNDNVNRNFEFRLRTHGTRGYVAEDVCVYLYIGIRYDRSGRPTDGAVPCFFAVRASSLACRRHERMVAAAAGIIIIIIYYVIAYPCRLFYYG